MDLDNGQKKSAVNRFAKGGGGESVKKNALDIAQGKVD